MYLLEINRLFLLTILAICSPIWAQGIHEDLGRSEFIGAPSMQVELLSSVQTIAPGDSFTVALRFVPEERWHFYWKNPGDTGLPTKLTWQETDSLEFSELLWPAPDRADYQGFINYGYYGETLLLTEVTTSESLQAGQPLLLQAQTDWLICEEVCIPGRATLNMELDVGQSSLASPWAEQIAQAQSLIPSSLGLIQGSYTNNNGFQISAKLPDSLASHQVVEFFPITANLVDNLTAASFAEDQGNHIIQTQNAPSVSIYPDTFEALVILEDSVGQQAAYSFEVAASAGILSNSSAAAATKLSFIAILLFALVGGLILNLMPCVLPVLSLKVMHLVEERDAANRRLQGIAYTAGVILSFMLIAGLMLGLRSAGETIGWGFQLQSPTFVAILIYVIFILGLSLSGFLELGASLSRMGNIGANVSGPVSGSFMTGALATVVATPCTAPFMGAAMGAAITMSIPLAMLVFATLGLGLALPFLIIAFVPAFANALPRPGQWMVTLKELLAFPLYLTAIWLLWVFANQTGPDQLAMMMTGLVLIVFGIWLSRINRMSNRRWISASVIIVWILALGILPKIEAGDASDGINKIPYSEPILASARANNQAVFVNMTADWCIACKVNERVALRNDAVEQLFADANILYLEGDWTNVDEVIAEVLERFNRNGVPLYLAYRPGASQAEVLPQILTPSIILEAFGG
jgi:thiol:disulfide interchange protein DsbD